MEETHAKKDATRKPLWLTILRVALGLVLFWRGIIFLHDATHLQDLIAGTGVKIFDSNASFLAFMITYINLLGGLLIAAGLFTRITSAIQVPILVLAVFFVNTRSGSTNLFELILSITVLLLLIFFAYKGSSSVSADQYVKNRYKARSAKAKARKLSG